MGLLTSLLTFPITSPYHGVKGVMSKIYEAVEQQYFNPDVVRTQLVALGDQLDRGDITEEAYEAAETLLLDRLDEIDAYLNEKRSSK
jgi:Gas vesicle protein G